MILWDLFIYDPDWFMIRVGYFLLVIGILGILKWVTSSSWLESHRRPETESRRDERNEVLTKAAEEANFYWEVEP